MNSTASGIFVHGLGAVSPAGWGLEPLRGACEEGVKLPAKQLARAGSGPPLRGRAVPPPALRPAAFAHPRLRRSSPISQYAVAAALEALGREPAGPGAEGSRLGIVVCVMSGCVNYSRRFYGEVLLDPVLASPVVFPETVFNAPSSHLAALLDTTAMNYTLVGDPGTFLLGLGLAAGWLWEGLVDECLVVGAEELDWLTADAFRLFARQGTLSEGAGAVLLAAAPATEPSRGGVELAAVTDVHLFWDRGSRASAAGEVAGQLAAAGSGRLLCDGLQGVRRLDQAEAGAWAAWKGARLSPKTVLGEGLMAAAAWQCVLAADAVRRRAYPDACVSVVGCNEQAMGARFQGLGTGPAPKHSSGPALSLRNGPTSGPGEGGGG